MLRRVSFQNTVAEIRVEYPGGQFLGPYSSPPGKVCVCGGGGRIGVPDDVSNVSTNFDNLKTLQTIHNLSSNRFYLGLK